MFCFCINLTTQTLVVVFKNLSQDFVSDEESLRKMESQPNSTKQRMGSGSRFMRGYFSSPEVVEEEVPDSGNQASDEMITSVI